MNHIARIYQPQPYLSVDGCFDVAIDQVQLGIIDLRIVGAYQPFLLRYYRLLGVVLLLRNHALLVEIGVTLQVALSIFQVRLVFEFRCFGLSKLHFIWSRINQREFIAFSQLLTFPKTNLHQLSVNATVNRDCVVGLNVPQPFEIDGNVALLNLSDRYRNSSTGISATCAPPALPSS